MEEQHTTSGPPEVLVKFVEAVKKGEFVPVQIVGVQRVEQAPPLPEQTLHYSFS